MLLGLLLAGFSRCARNAPQSSCDTAQRQQHCSGPALRAHCPDLLELMWMESCCTCRLLVVFNALCPKVGAQRRRQPLFFRKACNCNHANFPINRATSRKRKVPLRALEGDLFVMVPRLGWRSGSPTTKLHPYTIAQAVNNSTACTTLAVSHLVPAASVVHKPN